MIDAKDIIKLETHFRSIFATKEELQEVKSELKAEIIALRVEVKTEIGELRDDMRIMKQDIKSIKQMIRELLSCFNEVIIDQDKQGKEITIHKTMLNNHGDRIHLLEQNYVT